MELPTAPVQAEVEDSTTQAAKIPRQHTDSNPIPTDSMVTVRLSDPTPPSLEGEVTLDCEYTSPYYEDEETVIVHDSEPSNEDTIVETDDVEQVSELAAKTKLHRISTASSSMPSIREEVESEHSSGTFHARSNSSGTASSADTTTVDWDELEKTEEQEPRDEGSDEVGYLQYSAEILQIC